MSLKVAGELPLTTFFQPNTRRRTKENAPLPVVRKQKRKHIDEEAEAVLHENTKKRKEVPVLGNVNGKRKFRLRDVASSKQSSHLLTPHTDSEEKNTTFTYRAASSPQRERREVIDLSETQDSDLPSPSSFMRNVQRRKRTMNSRPLAARILPHTPPPTTRPDRKQVPRNPPLFQPATSSNRCLTVEQESATSLLPTPKSSVRSLDGGRTESLRKAVGGPTTPSGIMVPSSLSEHLSSPLSSLPATPIRRPQRNRDGDNCLGGDVVSSSVGDDDDDENMLGPLAVTGRIGDGDLGICAERPTHNPAVKTPAVAIERHLKGFKLPALSIHPQAPHNDHTIYTPTTRRNHIRKSPTRLTQTETQFVPSSQSQYMTSDDSFPRQAAIDQLVWSPTSLTEGSSNRKLVMSTGEIVQSSQTQVERELTMSEGYAQLLLSGQITTVLDQRASDRDQDEDMLHARAEFLNHTGTGHSSGIRTPTSSQVQRFSSFPDVSLDCAGFEDDTDQSSALPAQREEFDDMFEDPLAGAEDIHTQEQSQIHPQKDRADHSATESESDSDILNFYTDLVQKWGPEPSHSHRTRGAGAHYRAAAGIYRWPSQQNVDNIDELGGAPFDIPDECSSGTNGSFENSQHSLPEVVKDFFDMFQGSGSYPDDFPLSLRPRNAELVQNGATRQPDILGSSNAAAPGPRRLTRTRLPVPFKILR